jgi:hypothetical protein
MYFQTKTWFVEAFFSEHVSRFGYLFDIPTAEKVIGYTTGRVGFDAG